MRFTKYNSMTDILNYPNMREYLTIFYSEYLLEMYPKALYDCPIAREEQVAKTPWDEPFSIVADQLMDAANLVLDIDSNHTRRAIALWDYNAENKTYGDWTLEKNACGGKNQVCLIAPVMEQIGNKSDVIQNANSPAVIICPGGGYEEVCFSGEGTPIMHFMEANGYRAFMLKYRVGKDGIYPAPQEDLARAIQYVREHAGEYQINPNDICVIGGSAGGHLCASEAALYKQFETVCKISARPNKVVLCYPVISLEKEFHEGSARALCGGEQKETALLRHDLSLENLVNSDYPPTFVWTCADDDCVLPSNAVRMGEVLKNANVPYELHVYPTGGHGCALAFSKSAYDWSRAMLEFLKKN